MARPKKNIDPELIRKLARINCTMIEIGSVVGCSVATLERRYADLIKSEREVGKTSLRRWQWDAASKGNTALLIWLGKQHLNQSDKIEEKSETTNKIVISKDEENL